MLINWVHINRRYEIEILISVRYNTLQLGLYRVCTVYWEESWPPLTVHLHLHPPPLSSADTVSRGRAPWWVVRTVDIYYWLWCYRELFWFWIYGNVLHWQTMLKCCIIHYIATGTALWVIRYVIEIFPSHQNCEQWVSITVHAPLTSYLLTLTVWSTCCICSSQWNTSTTWLHPFHTCWQQEIFWMLKPRVES